MIDPATVYSGPRITRMTADFIADRLCCLIPLLFGIEREHIDEGIGLPDHYKTHNTESCRNLEESLNHAREILGIAHRALQRLLSNNWVDRDRRQQDRRQSCEPEGESRRSTGTSVRMFLQGGIVSL